MITMVGQASGGIQWGTYVFNPTLGTVTISGISPTASITQVVSVYNCTRGQMMYQNNGSRLFGGTLTAGVLHINQSCFGMDASDVLQIYIDSPDAMMNTIDTDHEHIHQGDMYQLCTHYTVNPTSSLYIQVNSGATYAMHIKRMIRNTSILDVGYTLWEAPTFTTGNAALTPFNLNRNSTNVSAATIYSNPTGVSGGTKLIDAYIPGTSFYRGLEDSPPTEIIYKPSTTYIGEIHNFGGNPALVYLTFSWYEVNVSLT